MSNLNPSKVIKQFKLLDEHRGRGASEALSVGIHTPELPAVEWMDDDVQSEIKTEFTSFYDGKVSKKYNHLFAQDARIFLQYLI